MQRFEIDSEEIDRLVDAFYARIRNHEILGPIFLRAVGAGDDVWRRHEAKIASFWRNAVGIDRSYEGTPMRVHLENLEVQPEHFPVWLALFHEVAAEVLPPDRAERICALADRIGQGLAMGLMSGRHDKGSPPVFA